MTVSWMPPESNLTLSDQEIEDKVETCKRDVKKLIIARAVLKRKITLIIKNVESKISSESLTKEFYFDQKLSLEEHFNNLKNYDKNIVDFYTDHGMFDLDPELLDNEVERQSEYETGTQILISDLKSRANFEGAHSRAEISHIMPNLNSTPNASASQHVFHNLGEARPPPLQCSYFSGKENDKFAFKTFLSQFNNVINSKNNLSNSAKLSYLKGYVTDYAFQVIQHLTISDNNFDIALELLSEELLDK